MLLHELLAVIPLIKRFVDSFRPNFKHGLSVTTAGLLQAPRGRVVKVHPVFDIAAIVSILEVIPNIYLGERLQLLKHVVRVSECLPNISRSPEVVESVLAQLTVLVYETTLVSNSDVKDDVRGCETHVYALVNSGVNVNVPDGTTVHQHVAFEVLGWECDGD